MPSEKKCNIRPSLRAGYPTIRFSGGRNWNQFPSIVRSGLRFLKGLDRVFFYKVGIHPSVSHPDIPVVVQVQALQGYRYLPGPGLLPVKEGMQGLY